MQLISICEGYVVSASVSASLSSFRTFSVSSEAFSTTVRATFAFSSPTVSATPPATAPEEEDEDEEEEKEEEVVEVVVKEGENKEKYMVKVIGRRLKRT